jgi:Family of unknown function (DUF5989)
MSFLREFYAFAKARKKMWMLPLVLVFAAFGGLLLLAKGTALAPFIYTVF